MEVEDQLLAFHEAGHAVVAWSLGTELLSIHIGDDSGAVRHKSFNLSLDPSTNLPSDFKKAKKVALILLGGRFAERALLELNGRFPESFCDEGDMEDLLDLTKGLFGDAEESAQEWVRQCEAEVHDAVIQHFDKIEMLAHALLTRKSLTSDDIRILLDRT